MGAACRVCSARSGHLGRGGAHSPRHRQYSLPGHCDRQLGISDSDAPRRYEGRWYLSRHCRYFDSDCGNGAGCHSSRCRRSDLPGRVRWRHTLNPHYPAGHHQPRRSSLGRVRTLWPGSVCAVSGLGDLDPGWFSDAGDHDPTHHHQCLRGSFALGAYRVSDGQRKPGRHPLAGHPPRCVAPGHAGHSGCSVQPWACLPGCVAALPEQQLAQS